MKINFSQAAYNIQYISPKPAHIKQNNKTEKNMDVNLYGLNALNNYNLAFTRKKSAVYVIDIETGERKRYNTQSKAADASKMRQPCISRAINNEEGYGKAGKYIFIDASIVETIDKNGNPHPHEKRIKEIIKQFIPQDTAYYAVNKNDPKDCIFFKNNQELLDGLKTTRSNLNKYISGETNNIRGRILIPADEIEYTDKSGATGLDEKKIKQILRSKKPASQNVALYIYKTSGKLDFYLTETEAAKEFGFTKQAINGRIKEGRLKIRGNIVIKADDIEYTNKNGKQKIDKAKLKAILKKNLPPYKLEMIDFDELIQSLET